MGAAISVFPKLHGHRVDKSGRAPLVLRIDLDSRPVAYDPIGKKPYKIPVDQWDAEARRVKKTHPNAAMLNNLINRRVAEIEGMFILKEQTGYKLNKKTIKELIKGNDPGICFFTFCEKQIKQKYDNPETIRTYSSELTKLKDYQADVSFRDIDYSFLQEYAAWMRDVRENEPNTIWKTFKFMNTMMNDAIKIGAIIEQNPFETFDRGKYKQTPRTFLTKTERPKLEAVLEKEIPDELYTVTVYMLFMVYCGLRFEDAMSFDYDQHIIDDERLVMETEKADESINIKLYPKLRQIVLHLKDHKLNMSNKEFNQMMKVVTTMSGIDKKITAHVGRHSFGRLLAETGVDIKKAQKLLGHRDERSTRIYYHMMDVDVDNEVDAKLGGV